MKGQGLELFDHLRRDILGRRRGAGRKDQGKGAHRVHAASIAAGTQMETKRAIGDSFSDKGLGLDSSGPCRPKN
ncbi:hypothetical protein GCM10011402_08500 [Paracoccus acridae]|uniref:Uncharacterized protein n=1 Tax=Paracoccus acridae TaxID=1795310 RepID=A0ABQ1VFK7_9RHOB|nr:hypothetical protein GCM10011402_08500 [Paracoccus acridae]